LWFDKKVIHIYDHPGSDKFTSLKEPRYAPQIQYRKSMTAQGDHAWNSPQNVPFYQITCEVAIAIHAPDQSDAYRN
jgi:hypothetical protein